MRGATKNWTSEQQLLGNLSERMRILEERQILCQMMLGRCLLEGNPFPNQQAKESKEASAGKSRKLIAEMGLTRAQTEALKQLLDFLAVEDNENPIPQNGAKINPIFAGQNGF